MNGSNYRGITTCQRTLCVNSLSVDVEFDRDGFGFNGDLEVIGEPELLAGLSGDVAADAASGKLVEAVFFETAFVGVDAAENAVKGGHDDDDYSSERRVLNNRG